MNKTAIKTLVLGLSYILFSYSTFGQSEIRGRVVSSITGLKPITDIYIEIVNINKPVLERMSKTDSLGFFSLENLESDRTYILRLTGLGYTNQDFAVETKLGVNRTTLTLDAGCEYSKEQAEIDWKDGKAKLLLAGSISPLANSPQDIEFERKYKIKYYDLGCTPLLEECIKMYNERMFELMDKKYSFTWRSMARPDVEYFED